MSKRHSTRHNKQPNYNLRRAVALGLGVAALSGAARASTGEPESQSLRWILYPHIEAAKKASDIVQDANGANGRKIENHIVKIENAGGIQGGVYYEQHGNSPETHDPDTIRYEKFKFEAVGDNNIKAATDTIAPDQSIPEAIDAFTSYLPEGDQGQRIVHPNQEITVGVDTETGDIIPSDQLPDDSALKD